MTVQTFATENALQDQIRATANTPQNKVFLIKFTATWCGPCKAIAPYFKELSNDSKYSTVEFVEVDVDDEAFQGLVSSLGVKSMPTFIGISYSKERSTFVTHGRISGADKSKLGDLTKFCAGVFAQ